MIAEAPSKLELRPYQDDGVEFLKSVKKGMLADRPGLGKTIQASEAAKDSASVMVVCPGYLCDQWFDHLVEQYPDDSIVCASTTVNRNGEIVPASRKQRASALEEKAKWLIINTEMMRPEALTPAEKKMAEYGIKTERRPKFTFPDVETIIFDESHHLRTRTSEQSKAAAVIAKKAERVYLLTATPIVKDPDDMWHQLHMLDPYEFDSYGDWLREHFYFTANKFGISNIRYRNKRDFTESIRPYVLGRTYDEVGLYLPDLIEVPMNITMEPSIRKMYVDLRDQLAHEDIEVTSYIECLHALRTVTANDPNKVNAVVATANESESFCIFTDYKTSARALGAKTNAVVITGDIPSSQRRSLAASSPRIVCTIDALCEGVDLSDKAACLFYEEDWTHGIMEQARSRIQRWSREGESTGRPVLCYYFHCRDTIDGTIHKKNVNRTVNARDVVMSELAKSR